MIQYIRFYTSVPTVLRKNEIDDDGYPSRHGRSGASAHEVQVTSMRGRDALDPNESIVDEKREGGTKEQCAWTSLTGYTGMTEIRSHKYSIM